jgi:hypothetical protein
LFEPTLPGHEIKGEIEDPKRQINGDLPKPYEPGIRCFKAHHEAVVVLANFRIARKPDLDVTPSLAGLDW